MGDETQLVLAGDVMTGRGVDQVLPHPGSPRLHEEYVVDARSYVDLAERVNGPVPKPVDPRWPWGESLAVMDAAGPAVRIMNLETTVTRSEDLAPRKAIHYRMSPANLEALLVAGVDVWTLANNHVLDHGTTGLLETLHTLQGAGLRTAGAGRDEAEAWRPVLVRSAPGTVVVAAVAHVSSGVPVGWTATPHRAGVALLPDLSDATADAVSARLHEAGGATALRVVSLHWGSNWGHHVPREQRRFAHRLVDGGVHVVHGHSSHHPRPLELYRGALILFGCGDLVNDYEGIGGYEGFRDDLRLLYLVRLSSTSGEVRSVRMVPFQARRLRLWQADPGDVAWLADSLEGPCARLGTRLTVLPEGTISVLTET